MLALLSTLTADVAPAPAIDRAPRAANAITFEPLGNGLIYSLNYERFLWTWNVGLRAGASFFTYKLSDANGAGNLTLATFPLVASWYWGLPHHKLQLGLGATILYFSASSDAAGTKFEGSASGLGIAATGVIGYRYIPEHFGFTFGAGFTPLVRTAKGFLPWGGVDVGIVF